MKNNMTISKKESRYLQLNEIKFSKQELIYVVEDEMLKFYSNKLTDFDSYSNVEKEKLINVLQNLANGNYDKLISDKMPNISLFDYIYNAKVVIRDDLDGCGNLEIIINLIPSWMENLRL